MTRENSESQSQSQSQSSENESFNLTNLFAGTVLFIGTFGLAIPLYDHYFLINNISSTTFSETYVFFLVPSLLGGATSVGLVSCGYGISYLLPK